MNQTVYVVACQSLAVGGYCGFDWFFKESDARQKFEEKKQLVQKGDGYQLAFYSKEVRPSPTVTSKITAISIELEKSEDEDFAAAKEAHPYDMSQWNAEVLRAQMSDQIHGEGLFVVDASTAAVSVVGRKLPAEASKPLIPDGASMIPAEPVIPRLAQEDGIYLSLAGSDEVPVLYYHAANVSHYHPAQYVRCNGQKASIGVWVPVGQDAPQVMKSRNGGLGLMARRNLGFVLTPEMKLAIGGGEGTLAMLDGGALSINGQSFPVELSEAKA
jgi:hypothetical protein